MIVLCLCGLTITYFGSTIPIHERIEAICEEENSWYGFWGVVLVAKGKDILFEKGYGYADSAKTRPILPELKFRIASITKQITAAAILSLMEEEKLSLNDTLSEYYPDFPDANRITLYQLLAHTSGIATLINTSEKLNETIQGYPGETTMEKTLSYLKSQPLRFGPGEGFFYSNGGYAILSAVIEKASGQTYSGFLSEHFFVPLGMRNTGYDPNAYDGTWALPCHRVSVEPDIVEDAPWVNREIPYGAGGLYSTVEDLLKWSLAINEYAILKPETVKLMETPENPIYGNGLGVFIDSIRVDGKSHVLIYHDGATAGSSTHLSRYPEEGLTIIVLSNLDEYDFTMLAYRIAKEVFSNE
jgi:CubicO group peptidase (beta-lactamase class C family)